uniref:Uncharacterized protein n=1 Tax=Avena sativa TaxID=4498 RepID=A0ACD5USV4_AVESA
MMSSPAESETSCFYLPPDHHHVGAEEQQQHFAEQEQLCYVHCNFCDTILVVGVPCSSLFTTVAVRCGHCANLLSVNLRNLLLPPPAPNQLPFGQPLLSPTSPASPHSLLDEMSSFQAPSSMLTDQPSPNVSSITSSGNSCAANNAPAAMTSMMPPPPKKAAHNKEPQQRRNVSSSSSGAKTTEKRQRVPSAYNRFIKDEIQRIKANNPDITHREAFSAAAKNWAHFPHIHFGLMPDQGMRKTGIQIQVYLIKT